MDIPRPHGWDVAVFTVTGPTEPILLVEARNAERSMMLDPAGHLRVGLLQSIPPIPSWSAPSSDSPKAVESKTLREAAQDARPAQPPSLLGAAGGPGPEAGSEEAGHSPTSGSIAQLASLPALEMNRSLTSQAQAPSPKRP